MARVDIDTRVLRAVERVRETTAALAAVNALYAAADAAPPTRRNAMRARADRAWMRAWQASDRAERKLLGLARGK
jgi:hypothetical protein